MNGIRKQQKSIRRNWILLVALVNASISMTICWVVICGAMVASFDCCCCCVRGAVINLNNKCFDTQNALNRLQTWRWTQELPLVCPFRNWQKRNWESLHHVCFTKSFKCAHSIENSFQKFDMELVFFARFVVPSVCMPLCETESSFRCIPFLATMNLLRAFADSFIFDSHRATKLLFRKTTHHDTPINCRMQFNWKIVIA